MGKYRAWLIYGKEDALRNESFIKMHQDIGKKLGMDIELLYAENISTGVEHGKLCLWYCGKLLEKPDFVLCRTRDWLLTRQLEKMNILAFNNSEVSLVGNDKAIAYQEVAALSIPVVDTCFCRREHLEEKLLRLFETFAETESVMKKSFVVKAVSGHGGGQVFLYEKRAQIAEILTGIGNDAAVIQPLITGVGEDLRVYVIGNKIKGCVLRRARNGFKSNFSLGGTVEPYTLTEEEKLLVERLFERWWFDFAGIDFIRDEKGQLLFNEIEDVVGSRMYYQCYENDILFDYLDYIRQMLEVKDLLRYNEE